MISKALSYPNCRPEILNDMILYDQSICYFLLPKIKISPHGIYPILMLDLCRRIYKLRSFFNREFTVLCIFIPVMIWSQVWTKQDIFLCKKTPTIQVKGLTQTAWLAKKLSMYLYTLGFRNNKWVAYYGNEKNISPIPFSPKEQKSSTCTSFFHLTKFKKKFPPIRLFGTIHLFGTLELSCNKGESYIFASFKDLSGAVIFHSKAILYKSRGELFLTALTK